MNKLKGRIRMSKIKDVFKDYKEKNNLINAEIKNVNLFKKTKKLEINIEIQEEINLRDISSFEDYLKERFQIEKVSIIVKYVGNSKKMEESFISQKIKKEWKELVKYLSKNYPLCKTILGTSTIEIEKNKIIVVLKTKSSDFLHSYEIDKEIENIASNIFGFKCKVEYKEDVNTDIIKEQKEYLNSLEKIACEDIIHEIQLQDEITKEQEQKEKEAEEILKEDNTKLSLIFGRTDKIKDKIVKIADLTTDYGRVAIEGKVISVDSRELKNGKTLAM